jgi:hypothetical protein
MSAEIRRDILDLEKLRAEIAQELELALRRDIKEVEAKLTSGLVIV